MVDNQSYEMEEQYNNSKEDYEIKNERLSIEVDARAQIVVPNADAIILAAVANQRFHMKSISVHNDAAGVALITFYDGAGGTELFHISVGANLHAQSVRRHIPFTVNTAVVVQSTAAAVAPNDVRVFIDGHWEYV